MEFIFQFGLVLLLVFLNGYFVASEFSLVAIRKTRVDELVKKGRRRAKILQKALDNLDRYISATQLGITIVSLALGWIGEPAIAHFIEPLLHFLPHEASVITAHTLAVAIAFTIITFLHIVLGELAPKTLALERPEKVALIIIAPLVLFAKVFQPFIWFLNQSGQMVIKLFRLHGKDEKQQPHSEEEVKMILQHSSDKGVIPEKEVAMVNNIFDLGDVSVKEVMVPRKKIIAFKQTTSLRDVVTKIDADTHSRFPVYEKSLDKILGFVHVKDIYQESLHHDEQTLLTKLPIVRKVLLVPEERMIGKVLQSMQRKRIHLAVVHNKKGKTTGIVTLEDIIESVVGEIEDEFDIPEEK